MSVFKLTIYNAHEVLDRCHKCKCRGMIRAEGDEWYRVECRNCNYSMTVHRSLGLVTVMVQWNRLQRHANGL
jgi:hypothetical protein